ncbi:hypothetical protein Tco_1189587 [Tanacetum coccineum]
MPKIEKTVNEQLEAEVLTRSSNESKISHAVVANLSELELKKILIDKMESNKSIHRSDEQKNLYKALVDAYKSEKLILDKYGDIVSFKRRQDDEDKDEEPSAGSNRRSKRRRVGKEPKSTKEPMHTIKDLEEPVHQEFVTGDTEDKPDEKTFQHPDWFQKPAKPSTPDRDSSKTLPTAYGPVQPWLSTLAQKEDTHELFNGLMDTPLDFSAFVMNRLKVNTLTLELLAGLTFELMKGSCKSLVELEYFFEEVYKATTDQLDWNNPKECRVKCLESARDVYSKRKIIAVTKLQIVEWHNYKHLDWITVRKDDDKLYTFKEGDFNRLCIQDIEDISIVIQRRMKDLQLGVESYQKKLNLTKPDTYRSYLKRKEAYTAYSNPRGFGYQNKDKKNRLLRIDELHKFSDGTLNDVRTALNDRLKGIRMKYLPQTIWRQSDRDKVGAMIQAIDKQLKTRRIMRSLEKFVCRRPYEGDFRLLQRPYDLSYDVLILTGQSS